MNEYNGPKSGAACWAAMEKTADDYRVTGTTKTGKTFARRLPPDAVIGWAMIFDPPAEVSAEWTPEQKRKFHNDSWEVMKKIEPRLFRKENLRMIAWHRDEEGDHTHTIGDARDENGKYCGNLIDYLLLKKINEQYPAMMRKLGWEIEDVELTDWDRYEKDIEYRDAVDAKRAGSGGLSVNDYMARKAAERAEQAAEMYQEAHAALKEAQEARKEAQKDRAKAKAAWDDVKHVKARAEAVEQAGEAHAAELARRRLPGEGPSDLERKLHLG